MDKDTKESRYQEFLESKCDEYLGHLIRIGKKLYKKGAFDEEKFSKTFLPQKEFVMKKIREEELQEPPRTSSEFDSRLFQQIREICKKFEAEFNETDEATKCDESPRAHASRTSMNTPTNYESQPKVTKKQVPHSQQHAHGDSHVVSQELNYGELSKIFVQKSRVDVVRSMMEKPDFEDHLETIYIYRQKPN